MSKKSPKAAKRSKAQAAPDSAPETVPAPKAKKAPKVSKGKVTKGTNAATPGAVQNDALNRQDPDRPTIKTDRPVAVPTSNAVGGHAGVSP